MGSALKKMANDHILLNKLDQFIRKYYKNRLIRGVLWALASITIFFLMLDTLEYIFHFNQVIRTVLFFTFIGVSLFLFARLIIIPALQLIKIGKVITHDQAAQIVGEHFAEIQDKLLNTLQLIKQKESIGNQSELLSASIEQKTNTMKVFRFNVVIDFSKNLRYLRYALIPVGIIALLALLSPKTISEPTRRFIRFNQTFIKPLPFRVEILNKILTAIQQEDFELQIKITGDEIPGEVFIKTKDVTYKMVRNREFVFSYLFKSLQGNFPFRIVAGDFRSEEYEIKVFPKPIILNFDVAINYPAYINKPNEKIENQGDFIVPEGTTLTWNFFTKDVTFINLRFDNTKIILKKENSNLFSYSGKIEKSSFYSISPVNDNTIRSDSLTYRISIVNDGFPSIFVTESTDSALATNIFFKGTIKDDYGFTKLTFNYSIYSKEDTAATSNLSEGISIDKTINNQVFYYAVDLIKLLPVAGQNIRYYFEVWDNDGIHGPKSTKSETRLISTPTIDEIAKHTTQNEQSMNQTIERSISDAKAMKKTMEELNKKLVDQSSVSWQEKKKIEDLIKTNQAIEEKVEEIKKKTNENITNEEKYLETSERIIEKQKQLKELMDQLLSDEMKKMIEEMKALLNQVDKEKLGNLLEKMKMSTRELETQLDRNLSLMKQIEFDRKLEKMINDLRKNADNQEKLAEETEKQQNSNEQLVDKQEKINQKADSLSKQLSALEKEGKQLENPADLGNTGPKEDSIHKNLTDSKKRLEEKKNNAASGSQKKAAKHMKDLAKQMEDSQEENENDQMEEDAANIRMILENLVRLSFDQEDLINTTKVINRNDPRYPEIVNRQQEFSEKLKGVEDSLNAIAKRQVMIKPVIAKEIAAITLNIALSLDAMENRNINMAVAKQQFSMTSINNLALLLNEALEKMNEQMPSKMQSKSGSKSCNKPSSGGGKMSAKKMKDLQQKIGEQLEKLKSGMEGAKKPGMANKESQNTMNKEIAKLAAEQEALRNEMQKYQDEMGSKGIKDQGSLNEAAKEMEQNEKDLVNKRITQETIRRQQNIMSRMLESEKAEQTREQEEKRESTEAKTQKISNPGLNYQYNMNKRTSQDNIQLALPLINLFYKNKVNSYIVKIEH